MLQLFKQYFRNIINKLSPQLPITELPIFVDHFQIEKEGYRLCSFEGRLSNNFGIHYIKYFKDHKYPVSFSMTYNYLGGFPWPSPMLSKNRTIDYINRLLGFVPKIEISDSTNINILASNSNIKLIKFKTKYYERYFRTIISINEGCYLVTGQVSRYEKDFDENTTDKLIQCIRGRVISNKETITVLDTVHSK